MTRLGGRRGNAEVEQPRVPVSAGIRLRHIDRSGAPSEPAFTTALDSGRPTRPVSAHVRRAWQRVSRPASSKQSASETATGSWSPPRRTLRRRLGVLTVY